MRPMASADSDAAAPAPSLSPPTLTRGFLFSDLRGYTAFVEARGAAAGADLLARYRMLVRDAVLEYRGAEIKTEGDSFYVVFSSVSAAVACALEIVQKAAEVSSGASDAPIKVGIGVNAGETVETPEGYVGSAVNLAARLCSAAAAGEVLVSQTVRDLTANTSQVRFEAVGRRRLKGIVEPVPVHRAVALDARFAASPSRRPVRTLVLASTAAIVVAGSLIAYAAFGGVARLSKSSAHTPSPGPLASSGTGIVVTDIVIPQVSDTEPEPTPVPLGLGRYRLTAFHPHVTFDVLDPGWTALEDSPDNFDLAYSDRGYFIGALIQVVSAGPCINSPTRLLDQTPQALIEWLQATRYVKVSNPTPITAGGYAGLSVAISVASAPTDCPSGPPGVSLFEVGDHVFSLRPTEQAEVMTLDVGDRPVTLLIGAQDAATYDRTVTAAGRIIQSLKIAP